MIMEGEKHNTRHRNTKIPGNRTRFDRSKRKQQKNNIKQVSHIKLN